MESIAKILRWMMGITLFFVAGFYIRATNQNTAYRFEHAATLLEQRRVLFNPFKHSIEEIVEELGVPTKVEKIRTEEKLLFWSLDPVTVQVHTHRDSVSRIAFMVSEDTIRNDVVREIIDFNGELQDWSSVTRGGSDASVEVLVNSTVGRTIEKSEKFVLLYGYVKG